MPPNENAPAEVLQDQGSGEETVIGQQEDRLNVRLHQVSIARLERRTADLAAIADWRDELQSKIRRAELRFEFVGPEVNEQDALAAEVFTFKQVCMGFAGEESLPLPERKAA